MPRLILSEKKTYQSELKSPNQLISAERELKSHSSFVGSSILEPKSIVFLGNTYDKIRNQIISKKNSEMISEIKNLGKLKDKLQINLANVQRKLESEGTSFLKMTQEKSESYFLISSLLEIFDNQVEFNKMGSLRKLNFG